MYICNLIFQFALCEPELLFTEAPGRKNRLWPSLEFHLNACQKCWAWKPLLSKRTKQDFPTTEKAVPATNSMSYTPPEETKGLGWHTLFLPKKTWGELRALTPPPKSHNNRTSGMCVLTMSHRRGCVVSRSDGRWLSPWYQVQIWPNLSARMDVVVLNRWIIWYTISSLFYMWCEKNVPVPEHNAGFHHVITSWFNWVTLLLML